MTHLYTLKINPDGAYSVSLDDTVVMSGNLNSDVQPPVHCANVVNFEQNSLQVQPDQIIDDPDDKKPADWDDREKIDDPDAVKPDDWLIMRIESNKQNVSTGTRMHRSS